MKTLLSSLRTALLWSLFWCVMALVVPFMIIAALVVGRDEFNNRLVEKFCRFVVWMLGFSVRIKVVDESVNHLYPVIYVANHVSFFDIFISGSVLPGYPRGYELKKHFTKPFYGWFITIFGQIPLDPSNKTSIRDSLKIGQDLLGEKVRSLFIMPEGSRTRDGKIGSFSNGAFYLASKTGVPIIPVIFKNLYLHNNPNSLRISPGKVDLVIGRPFYFSDFETKEAMSLAVREYMENILEGE